MTDDLQDRVAQLEHHARRIIPARDGTDGWCNYIQTLIQERLLEERDFLTEVVAMLQREFSAQMQAMLDTALATRVRGTYQAGVSYVRGDMVALDGGSFIARKDNPGKCPGDGWQLMAKQGARGIAGPKGERGPPGNTITSWIVDRSNFRVTPRMSDGTLGPPLELRELFAPSEDIIIPA
jgi:hypothetical protein